MLLGGVSFEKAKHLLDVTNGFVHEAIEKAKGGTVTCEK